MGWVGELRSPGTSLRGTLVSTMGQMGLPVTRLNTQVTVPGVQSDYIHANPRSCR